MPGPSRKTESSYTTRQEMAMYEGSHLPSAFPLYKDNVRKHNIKPGTNTIKGKRGIKGQDIQGKYRRYEGYNRRLRRTRPG